MVAELLGNDIPYGVIRSSVLVRLNASGSVWSMVRGQFGAEPESGSTYRLHGVLVAGASHKHLAVYHNDGKIAVLARALWEYLQENQDAAKDRWKFIGPVLSTNDHAYVLALPEKIVDSGIVVIDWSLAPPEGDWRGRMIKERT